MIRTAFVCGLFLAAAGTAEANPIFQVAAPPSPAADPARAAVEPGYDPHKVVCRSMRPPTGTRLQSRARERVCQTQEEWDNQRDEAQAATREVMRGDRDSNQREFIAPGGVSQPGGPG